MKSEIFKGPIPKKIKIIFVDFDGTIKPTGGHVSRLDITAMAKLGSMGIIRVVATGRGLFSFQRDFPERFELDYLLFSSGLGLCPWTKGPGELMVNHRFADSDRDRVLAACLELKRGFFAFEPPPNCHRHVFLYPEGFPPTMAFLLRLRSYNMHATAYEPDIQLGPRSEFLICVPKTQMPKVKKQFEALCPGFSILCSTSPYGDDSLWLEIFPPGINKGTTAKFLAESLSLTAENALAIGNDFNDQALLSWAEIGLVNSNAPKELQRHFPLAPIASERPLNWLHKLMKTAK
ncbi:MAG: Cof-type HAD-IIB family hydrolase [Deltaproteobacteria bacterium]|jgi:hydroxymethylpyrimidine pyrophosphatase-like HAD family hydrolase|nr:Cof-type HAD-IIB family hydrolase [Deltaproteobacteria bacterium]